MGTSTTIHSTDRLEAQRRWLRAAYRRFHHRRYLCSDPLRVLYRFDDPMDREIIGLVAACLAYGNVKAILGGIDDALMRLSPSPRSFLDGTSEARLRRAFRGFRYRVTAGADLAALMVAVKRIVNHRGGLHESFHRHLKSADANTLPALGRWVEELCRAAGRPLYHLLPHPERGSACKRLNLYLRWMVRRDAIDPGGWDGVRPRQLIVPLDTHLHRVAVAAGLTHRRQADLRTAVAITDALRAVCPSDPLRYDFALTRPGILRLPLQQPMRSVGRDRQLPIKGCS